MRLAKRQNDEIILGDKISTIKNLENSQLILLERGDKIKKQLKKIRFAFGKKNLCSVKSLNESLNLYQKTLNKKLDSGCWCCVCVENWTKNTDGICNDCQL